ncbi:hypothetical protein AB832_01125 [Flavobacteriaceae bacterium (ex Bugula neritina AB1)]|nr:hypothetical protein AB832_01125 [Flavobacteriaceae bacterium (ex Bugula neritina AB1)]
MEPYLSNIHSFEKLYQAHWRKIYGICFSKTGDVQASEEMVQDIFVSLWRRRKTIIIHTSIEAFLVKAAKLKIIDYYRKESRVRQLDYSSLNIPYEFEEKHLSQNQALYNFLEEDLEMVVSKLPTQCQKVYRLSREENLKIKEIASKLLISEKTVKNHLTKALYIIKREVQLLGLITLCTIFFLFCN